MTNTGKTCATEGCDRTAVGSFEHGGIGSEHCQPCLNAIAGLASRTQETAEWRVEAVAEKLIDLLNRQGFIHPKREDHRKLAENMAIELVRAAFITPPAPERSKEEVCPDCGRVKAKNAQDAANGLCPKWWAIRDEAADADCLRFSAREALTTINGGENER